MLLIRNGFLSSAKWCAETFLRNSRNTVLSEDILMESMSCDKYGPTRNRERSKSAKLTDAWYTEL